jgi:predicted TPR repeat methyltransferase
LLSSYYSDQAMGNAVATGRHREVIGGMWEDHGERQLAFLVKNGLRPEFSLLDIGCGALRLGVPAVRFLNANNYYGTDISRSLIDAGYEKELKPLGLTNRLPRSNLIVDGEFEFSGLPARIDFVMAQSVFTHLPINHLRLCLASLADRLSAPCTFFFTFYAPPEPAIRSHEQFPGVVTFAHKDPYHLSIEDIEYANSGLRWKLDFIGDWGHPKKQLMMKATLER